MWDDSEKLSFVLLEGVRGTLCADDGCLLPLAEVCGISLSLHFELDRQVLCLSGRMALIVYNDNS